MLLPSSFTPLWSDSLPGPSGGLWFLLEGGRLLTTAGEGGLAVPAGEGPPIPVDDFRCIGRLGEVPCWAARARVVTVPAGFALEPLRSLFDRLPDELVAVAGRAAQVLDFERSHRYCGACATPTEPSDGGRARRCPACGEVCYPRIAPAMMVLVTREGSGGR